MLIGLISDTHIPDRARELPKNVISAFQNVDLILHAGDLTSMEVIDELEKIAPTIAIQGNMDRAAGIILPNESLPICQQSSIKVIEAAGIKIGIAHGEVYPRADTQQLLYLAKQLDADILVTGHSHQPKIEQIDGILLLNPGSPIVPRLADRTVMLLEINNKDVDVEVVKIGNPVCSALDLDKFKGE